MKNGKILFGVLLIVIIAVIMYLVNKRGTDPGPVDINPDTGEITPISGEDIINGAHVVQKKEGYDLTKCDPMERLRSSKTIGTFRISGKGSNTKWAFEKTANFEYFAVVECESRILKKESKSSKTIKVVEERKFNIVRDDIIVSDADLKLIFDETPLDVLGMILATMSSGVDTVAPGLGGALCTGSQHLTEALKKMNGASLLDFFEKLNEFLGKNTLPLPSKYIKPIPFSFKELIKKLSERDMANLMGISGIRTIAGKTFIISCYQHKENGTPLYITIKNEDGSKITEEEKRLLKRINTFLDYDVVPYRELKNNQKWSFAAGSIQEAFDPYIEGNVSGDINVTFQDNNGLWNLIMDPCTLAVLSSNGTTTGSVEIQEGSASVSPKDLTVEEIRTKGLVDIKHISQHHLLFQTKIEGRCNFEGVIISEPLNDKPEEAQPSNDESSTVNK